MTKYEVILHVEEDHLPAVIGVVKGSAVITGVRPLDEPRSRKNFRYAGGKRLKGVTGEELIRSVVADGTIHGTDEFVRMFKDRGFAEQSAYSTLSKAMRTAVVDRVGPNSYCRAGALPHLKMVPK